MKNMKLFILLTTVFTSLLISSVVYAHWPTINNGRYHDASTAWEMTDINLSSAMYHEVTEEAPHLWLKFDATSGTRLYVQLGVPVLDRLQGYYPKVAILTRGYPDATETLPFELRGAGMRVRISIAILFILAGQPVFGTSMLPQAEAIRTYVEQVREGRMLTVAGQTISSVLVLPSPNSHKKVSAFRARLVNATVRGGGPETTSLVNSVWGSSINE